MKQLFFKLVKAFESNGACCQHHCSKTEVEQLKRERLKTGDFPWKNVPNEEHVSNFTELLKFTFRNYLVEGFSLSLSLSLYIYIYNIKLGFSLRIFLP
ncbi:hypothetical protein NC653_031412 [Populus alba x Populus x berolinensis]|uniref:Uncharacterized protein n=1 Tax=Populus alba x Populus x berolinensis TaxID=444605 RepID=A0AAD6Q1C0_9ROSI|nr:hypothetical protein NC653_031412 [Populus alba x Populus x berolinensis]